MKSILQDHIATYQCYNDYVHNCFIMAQCYLI